MFDHLRYQRGEVVAHSRAGEHTIKRLDLNPEDAVMYRESQITHLARTASDLTLATKMLEEAKAHEHKAESAEQKMQAAEAVNLAEQAIAAAEQLLVNTIGPLALAAARMA